MGKRGAPALARNPNWKGGRTIASNGYVLVKRPDHPDADVRGYIYEHRLVAEQKLGRRLLASEQVHHIDGSRKNNDPANIEVVSATEHRARHRRADRSLRDPGEPNPTVECGCGCGETFDRYDASGRPRTFVSGHNPQPAERESEVVAILARGPAHRSEIAREAGATLRAAAVCLSKLKRQGRAESLGGGRWRLVAHG